MDAEDERDGETMTPMEARESKFSSMEKEGEDDVESWHTYASRGRGGDST